MAEQIDERVREMFGDKPIPLAFSEMLRVHPAFATDFYMNFKRFVWADGYLNVRTKAAIGMAISLATGCRWMEEFMAERVCDLEFPAAAIGDIRALVAVNAMYNLFFKLPDVSDRFRGMAVGLRGHTIASTCLDNPTIELIGMVIGALNGCRTCMTGHARAATSTGVGDDAILEAIQCAATILSGCVFLNSL